MYCMNIFVLDRNPEICAKYHNNKHVVKMILETAQLLCSVHHMTKLESEIENVPYRLSHKNHPCSIWARECIENYVWLCDLGMALAREYTHRYKKIHKTQAVIEWCMINLPDLPEMGNITEFAKAMPDECKVSDVVESYRRYYIMEKRDFCVWTNRNIPEWFK
jgi:hypothetical protein